MLRLLQTGPDVDRAAPDHTSKHHAPQDIPMVDHPLRRVVEVLAPADWTRVRRIWVDLEYHDPANDVRSQASMAFTATSRGMQVFSVHLADPGVRRVTYHVTVLGTDGRVTRSPDSQTVGRRLAVRPGMVGHRVLVVTAAAGVFAERGISRVVVQVRHRDPAHDLGSSDVLTLDAATDLAVFEYDYVDPDCADVEVRWRAFRNDGMAAESGWSTVDGRRDVVVPH